MSTFVPSARAELYDTAALLGAWTAEDFGSYTRTLDAEVFLAATAQGLREPALDQVATARALHDVSITRALNRQLVGTRPVAVMGGHDMSRADDDYRLVAECARALTEAGFTMISGGGPGAMEATHLGATFAYQPVQQLDRAIDILTANPAAVKFPLKPKELVVNGAFDGDALKRLHAWQAPAFDIARANPNAPISIGIPTWLYGHEPPTPLAPLHAKYFENSIREDGLLAVAIYGVLYAPGRAGTLQEIFQDAAQNYYRTVADRFSPMVFLNLKNYWTTTFPVDVVLNALFDTDGEKMTHYVTNVDDVVHHFLDHANAVARWAAASTGTSR